MVKKSIFGYAIFLTLGVKLILGCVVVRNLHHCNVGLVSFSQLKEILGQQTVLFLLIFTYFYVKKKT
jgi:hypothetical protein